MSDLPDEVEEAIAFFKGLEDYADLYNMRINVAPNEIPEADRHYRVLYNADWSLHEVSLYLNYARLRSVGGIDATAQGVEGMIAMADQGDPFAQYCAGAIHLYAIGAVEQDPEKGIEYICSSARQELPLGLYALGSEYFMNQSGILTVDKERAFGVLKRGADQRHKLCLKMLFKLHKELTENTMQSLSDIYEVAADPDDFVEPALDELNGERALANKIWLYLVPHVRRVVQERRTGQPANSALNA